MFSIRFFPTLVAASFTFAVAPLFAQQENGWKAHDKDRPAPQVVSPGEDNSTSTPPSDAIVLFDGNSMDAWRSAAGGEAKWKVVNGAMESVAGAGYVYTKRKFGDCQLHVEWASPSTVKGNGQGRGNSGVFLGGNLEVQVLDSYENPTYADGSAGSIYGQYTPLVNACRKPGEWQSYDIIYKTPRFDDEGKLSSPAMVTVLHNGVVIHHGTEPFGPTAWIFHDEYAPDKVKGPIGFQDHGNPVRYRNIWVREIAPRPVKEGGYPQGKPLGAEEMTQVAGNYGREKVLIEDGKLFLQTTGKKLEMVALEGGDFALKMSAGRIKFERDETGKSTKLILRLDCGKGGEFSREQ